MSWVQELFDIVGKFNFVETVYEYQQGLYFRCGDALEKRIRWDGKDLEDIVARENSVREMVGWKRFVPFARPQLPDCYRRSKVLGRIREVTRDVVSKNLRPGIYFFIPFFDGVVTDSQQERMVSLGTITLDTRDVESETKLISPNIRYQLIDYYKAFTAVHDYESSLKDYVLSALASSCRDMSRKDWTNPDKVSEIEQTVLEGIADVASEWGLKVKNVYVVDSGACNIQKLVPKSPLVVIQNKVV
jgi:hypothetical protein